MPNQGSLAVKPIQSACIGAVLAAAVSSPAAADADPEARASLNPLETVVVTATRGPREKKDVAGTVTTKSAEEIQRELARDIKDLVRYEPGISVANSAGRFGLSGFNVRGIDGDRVLIEVDGAPVADAFSIGSFASAGRDYVDLEVLKRVEILRGAASSLYGSDALGGVVAFETKDPDDLIADGASTHLGARAAWFAADDSYAATATGAWRGDALSALVLYTKREGHELDNEGRIATQNSTRTRPDPQNWDSDNVLAKLMWDLGDGQQLRLTVEGTEENVFTDAISGRRTTTTGPSTVQTLDLTGDDDKERTRVAIDHDFAMDSGLAEQGSWQVYWQNSETVQNTEELRLTTGTGPPVQTFRERRASFEQEVIGGELTLRKSFQTAGAAHLLTYGLELLQTDTEQLRNGQQTNLTTGAVTSVIQPDAFPVRDFPLTETLEAALFIQDEISLGDGRWSIIPGVRGDYYDLNPTADDIYTEDNPLSEPESLNHTSVSPKLGVVRHFSDSLSAYAQYAQGFRAPPYDDVNIGFTNIAFGYTAIPNPDLKPETSYGFEIGLRGGKGGNYFSVAAFHNDYDELIESLVAIGVDPESGLLVFQSQNIAKARIYGIEFTGGFEFSTFSPALEGFYLRSSAAWADGENRTAGEPLNSIDPLKGVIGLGYSSPGDRWGAELVVTAVDRKEDIDESLGPQFSAPGYEVIDLLGHFEVSDNTTVNVGISNLADATYWEWSDVRGRSLTDPTIDRYTRPGRSASASINFRF